MIFLSFQLEFADALRVVQPGWLAVKLDIEAVISGMGSEYPFDMSVTHFLPEHAP
jgi:hypothetical protein